MDENLDVLDMLDTMLSKIWSRLRIAILNSDHLNTQHLNTGFISNPDFLVSGIQIIEPFEIHRISNSTT